MTADPADDDLIDGPRWRTRTSPERRHRMAIITFVIVLVPGLALMAGSIWALGALGAPAAVAVLPWLLPTLAVVAWAIRWPSVAEPTDDDEQTWPGFAIRYVIVGETTPRSSAARLAAATVFGGPIGWSVMVVGTLAILGLA